MLSSIDVIVQNVDFTVKGTKFLIHPYKLVTDENVDVNFTYLVPLKISTQVTRINTKKSGEVSWLRGLLKRKLL